jgi:hypothetical protein
MANGSNEPALTRDNFDEFIEDTGLIETKAIAIRTVTSIWESAQMGDDDFIDETTGLKRETSNDADGMETQQIYQSSSSFGGDSSMVYCEFLEAMACLACHYVRNPFLPIDSKLDLFFEYLQSECPKVEQKRRMHNQFKGKAVKRIYTGND